VFSVFIIGTGRLAKNLANAFKKNGIELKGVYSKTLSHAKEFSTLFKIPCIADLADIPADCDVYILAVSDQAIEEVSNQLEVKGIVVHCSGMESITVLNKHKQTGVFWPIQTFSNNYYANFSNNPICIESNDANDLSVLEFLSDKIGANAIFVSEIQRQQLHLSAVLVNNFTNHLFVLAQKFLEENDLPFEILKPLIHETVSKLEMLSPSLAQTGPALRNDLGTLQKHQELLAHHPSLLSIYKLLSESILQNKS